MCSARDTGGLHLVADGGRVLRVGTEIMKLAALYCVEFPGYPICAGRLVIHFGDICMIIARTKLNDILLDLLEALQSHTQPVTTTVSI